MNGKYFCVSGKHFRVSLTPMTKAYIGIGGNLGQRERFIEAALAGLSAGAQVLRTSKWYETAPWKMEDAPDFINLVAEVETLLSPEDLLELCLSIERKLGRRRDQRVGYASRTIDLDLLLYGDAVVQKPYLVVPHPGLADRKFVIQPLCDLVPAYRHPVLGRTLAELYADCLDQSEVRLWESPTATLV